MRTVFVLQRFLWHFQRAHVLNLVNLKDTCILFYRPVAGGWVGGLEPPPPPEFLEVTKHYN